MSIRLVKIYAALIGVLAILGLFANGHLFGVLNVDPAMDTLRVVLMAILLFVGFGPRDVNAAHIALFGVGLLYISMGVIGLGNPTLGGLLPSGLTGFDVAFHLAAGVAAAIAGLTRSHHLAAGS